MLDPLSLCCMQLPDHGIFATLYEKPGDYDQPWDPDVHFVASTNFFGCVSPDCVGHAFLSVGRVMTALTGTCMHTCNRDVHAHMQLIQKLLAPGQL